MTRGIILSVIIPTLNEAEALGPTLDALARLPEHVEVIVVDGGSCDRTVEVAREHGARVLAAARGRGLQMHAGARAAQGKILWFLHADTLAPADAAKWIAQAFSERDVIGGNFTVRFAGRSRGARFLTWLYPRLRTLGLFYGDSAIFVRREAYERVGGFQPFPIFEDLDLVRRLQRFGQMVQVPSAVVTSSRRFEGRSFARTFLRWTALQALYWLGVHPYTLGGLYGPIRRATD